MTQHYYNTANLAGEALVQRELRAGTQDAAIFDFFQARPGQRFTPSEVSKLVLPGAPITSARRAITDLTAEGRLRKCQEQKAGPHGDPEHCWMLRTDPVPVEVPAVDPRQRSIFELLDDAGSGIERSGTG